MRLIEWIRNTWAIRQAARRYRTTAARRSSPGEMDDLEKRMKARQRIRAQIQKSRAEGLQ